MPGLNAPIGSVSLGQGSCLDCSGAPVLLVQQHLRVSRQSMSKSLPEHLRCQTYQSVLFSYFGFLNTFENILKGTNVLSRQKEKKHLITNI